MIALHRITGVTYKDIVTNEPVFKMTELFDLENYQCGHGHDGLTMFTEEKITMC